MVFQYGNTREYKNSVITSPESVYKNQTATVSATIKDLEPGKVYFCRLRANMGDKVLYSDEKILSLIEDSVIMVPLEIKQLTDNSLSLRCLINSNGKYIYGIQIEYGIKTVFEDSVNVFPGSVWGTGTQTVHANLENLIPLTRYYFRFKATDGHRTYYSNVFSNTPGGLAGLDDEKETDGFVVFPNPTYDNIQIQSLESFERIEILDAKGNLLLVETQANLNLANYPAGLYYVKIYTSSKLIIRKIVKL